MFSLPAQIFPCLWRSCSPLAQVLLHSDTLLFQTLSVRMSLFRVLFSLRCLSITFLWEWLPDAFCENVLVSGAILPTLPFHNISVRMARSLLVLFGYAAIREAFCEIVWFLVLSSATLPFHNISVRMAIFCWCNLRTLLLDCLHFRRHPSYSQGTPLTTTPRPWEAPYRCWSLQITVDILGSIVYPILLFTEGACEDYMGNGPI